MNGKSRTEEALAEELRRIQESRRRSRRKYFRPSRLDPYRKQIQALAAAGGSREDIRIWLRQGPRIEVHGSTISRALLRWEAQNPQQS
jgi:hypothetical protein